jgi:DNA polymerase-3 subunit beta
MKITCDREKLLAAFQTAAMVAPTRSPKPILQNVKLEVTEQGVVLMATDLEFGVRISVPGVDIAKPGAAVLPVQRFNSILRESSDEKLRIEGTERGYVVKGDRSEFKLPAENPDEFPNVAAFKEEKYHIVAAPLFREIVTRTEFATDLESSRYALGGVLLEMEGSKILAVGTDGRRLSKMEGPAEAVGGHSTADTQTIVRTQSMRLLGRALSDADEQVHICSRGNDVVLRTSRATFVSRLVEGRFPRWRDVFPRRTNALKFDMTVGPFFSALRQAAVVASDDSRGIDFDFEKGTMLLTARNANLGESRIEMPIPYDGDKVGVTLDHKFVADFLKVLKPEQQFVLEIENADAAALFSTDDGYAYVLMPLARDR